jgi:hypothetical protein
MPKKDWFESDVKYRIIQLVSGSFESAGAIGFLTLPH